MGGRIATPAAMTIGHEPRARRGLLVGAWVLLVVAAAVWGVANEELDLESRTSVALADAGLPGVVDLEGRDVLVAGVDDASERAAVVSVVLGVRGVRSVGFTALGLDATDRPRTVVLSTSTSAAVELPSRPVVASSLLRPPEPAIAYLEATVERGRIIVEGVIPSEDAAARIGAIVDLIYAPFVTSALVVEPLVVSADWVDRATGAIAVLPIVSSARLRIEGNRAVVSGFARSDARASQLVGAISAALGTGIDVDARITITDLEAPVFEGRTLEDGSVVLTGVMPTAEVADAIAASVIAVYGPENVVNDMEVRDGIDATFSLFRLPLALPFFAPFAQWEVAIVDDAISGSLRGGASFASGSSRLTPQLEGLLDIAAGILIRNPTLAMRIEGHTDSIGGPASNLALSNERAEAAERYLVAVGLEPSRLTSVGYGESRPIADDETQEGRARNRRVEFSLGPRTQGDE